VLKLRNLVALRLAGSATSPLSAQALERLGAVLPGIRRLELVAVGGLTDG
jgi:hypothetical protein